MNRRHLLAGFVFGTPWVSAKIVRGSEVNFTVEARLQAMVTKLQTAMMQTEAERAAASAEAERLKKELTAARQEIESWKTIVSDYGDYNATLEEELYAARGRLQK